MDLKEISQMSPDEEMAHWWIQTRFRYLDRALQTHPSDKAIDVLEVGCGTCQNLRYLRTSSPNAAHIGRVAGLDVGFDSTRVDTSWAKPKDWFGSDLEKLPQNSPGLFDVLVAMDVLEHIEDDFDMLRCWNQKLRPGGLVFATVPAFPALWSQHDVLLGHKRRYTRATLEALAQGAGLKVLRTCYAFSHIFPLVYLIRKLHPPRPPASEIRALDGAQETGLKKAPASINALLRCLGHVEARFGGNAWFGTSVIGLFQKPEGTHV